MVKFHRPSFRVAQQDAVQNNKVVQRTINKVWNAAPHAPMFRREYQAKERIKNEDGSITIRARVEDGKPVMLRRSVRLIQGHAFNIACAGGVSAAVNEIKRECDTWNIDYPQSTNHPFLLGLPAGTKLMLEQFLSAYVATGVLKSTRAMKALGKHTRLNKAYIQRAFSSLNEAMQSAPGSTRAPCIVPLKVAKKKDEDDVPSADADAKADAKMVAAAEAEDE